MLFLNKSKKVIRGIFDYYEGKVNTIQYSSHEIESAIEYAKKHQKKYSKDVIEKLEMVKAMIK